MNKTISTLLILLSLASSATSSDAAKRWPTDEISIVPVRIRPQSETSDRERGQSPDRELKVGQPIERKISGGETQVYRLSLVAGEYSNIIVQQRDIDLVVTLFGPQGGQLAEIDWQPKRAAESIWVLAEVSGDYRIEVAPNDKGAKSDTYAIQVRKIGEWKDASSDERSTISAHKLYSEADKLLQAGTGESVRAAIAKFQESLAIWRSVKDMTGEAKTLNQIGYAHARISQAQKSIELYINALDLWRKLGNRRNEAEVLNNLGVAYYRVGETQKGVGFVDRGLQVSREIGDRNLIGLTLNALGTLYDALYDRQKSLECYLEAVQIFHSLDDPRWEAAALDNVGLSYALIGESQRALENLLQALTLRRAVKDFRGEGYTLQHIGYAFEYLGEVQKALEYYAQSLPLYRKTGDPGGISFSLAKLGLLSQRAGDLNQSLDYYKQALPLAREARNKDLEGQILAGLAVVYINLNNITDAISHLNQALVVQREAGAKQGEAYSTFNIGECLRLQNEPSKALDRYHAALQISHSIGNRAGEAMARFRIAEVERDRGNLAEARKQIEDALVIIETLRTKIVANELRTSYFARSQTYYAFYIDLLMQQYRQDAAHEHLVEAFQANERARARGLLDSLIEAGANIQQGAPTELIERERALRRGLTAKTEQHMRLLTGKHTDEQIASVVKEIEAQTTVYERVLAQIRESSPRYAALTQPRPLTLKEIQDQVLDDQTVLLEYALGEKRSYLWALTSSSVAAFELPSKDEIEKLTRRAYDLLTSRRQQVKFERTEQRRRRIAAADAEYFKVAEQLSRIILEPAASYLKKNRVLIVGDGALQYLPFGSLPQPNSLAHDRRSSSSRRMLVELHEIVNLPSASTLAVLRRETEGRRPAPKTIAVLADPVFDGNDERLQAAWSNVKATDPSSHQTQTRKTGRDSESELSRAIEEANSSGGDIKIPRLPFSRKEAEAIARIVPPPQIRQALDFDASKSTAHSPELSQYRIVHFATHGFANTAHPYLSGIVLSLFDEKGSPKDGFLMAHEVYNLTLPAELVVLSGCRTGLGKEVRGEGLLALTRSFMYAGAARVMVSLWDIDDESTAELMRRFYQAMLGKHQSSPASALRSAQVSMLKDERWSAPYFWAGFILQGEPQ